MLLCPVRFRFATAVLLLTTLAACGGPPWALSRSAHQITLRWYSDNTSLAEARAVARRYCAQRGGTTALDMISRGGSAAVARYRCG
jgi:putative hemolysin